MTSPYSKLSIDNVNDTVNNTDSQFLKIKNKSDVSHKKVSTNSEDRDLYNPYVYDLNALHPISNDDTNMEGTEITHL